VIVHQHHHLIPNILHFLAGGFMGLVAASLTQQFGWRSADRLPGESRWPHCVFCLAPHTWQDVFPFFGWLLRPDVLKLPCPCARRTGLWAQPTAEAIGFALGVLGMYLGGWSPLSIPLCIGLGILPGIAIVDLYFGIMPDGSSVALAVAGIAWLLLGGGDIYSGLIIAAVLLALGLFCAVTYSRWRGKEMLGLGDVKFFAAAGLWLDPQMAPWFLALAGFIGAINGFAWQRFGGGKESPFAPALCISLAACILYQIFRMP
jgi:leader peptidase (prepilin peptidase)/N-methyltransferase